MNAITKLKACNSRVDLALLLKFKPSILTYILYKTPPASNYTSFTTPKKSGGVRTINAPSAKLKSLQKNLSELLLDCVDDINKAKNIKGGLAHGFVRERSIITNAEMHKNTKNVLNIDLDNFFGSFNFGRVRGFFQKNRNFMLSDEVATTIAQIACFNDELPQGSPCSPVITNLITHSLDIQLLKLANRNACTYSRYADDITFSTRKSVFPVEIMEESNGVYTPSKRLLHEVKRSGFQINHKKTRIQYKDSRQDVTGLIVNKKIGVKKEYRRITKSMCNRLFHHGSYTKLINGQEAPGTINELEGRLNFIDSIDLYNRITYPEKLSIHYTHRNYGFKTRNLLSGREKTFSQFLFYKWFYAPKKPTILCEGKTDNIYLASAIKRLSATYPKLAITTPYESLVNYFNYSKRTRFLLELFGGTSYLAGFIGSYSQHYSKYTAPKPEQPVIIVLDNDSGLGDVTKALAKIKTCVSFPEANSTGDIKIDIKKADFVHVVHNLYIIVTPLDGTNDTMIEHLFETSLWSQQVHGRTFDPTEKRTPKSNFYGKNIFATEVVRPNKDTINFDGFHPLFERMTKAIDHFESNL
ncbi:RNA-directed DNA polymerase / Ribonuclease H [Vibrio crassostreae]|nr:RNA-directed DNA polymerase / Ribonuclease H [Vibrio crassostreae]CAK3195471.1 RNA-directed DNA polymerase / Ribonuclease H [Vibrio crassostreae]CAK3220431.1 RNA-directed DNA polymerase / Ribonuclease H [Vibrio crassostreae]CAK3231513.1 RNA-directed DNA polymerase / Ribonuclease H [Vibrio crassostreae]CAK3232959.1 RNA-directed DNA polymerase / Ribonuclease H [Vibrio crassostreae]